MNFKFDLPHLNDLLKDKPLRTSRIQVNYGFFYASRYLQKLYQHPKYDWAQASDTLLRIVYGLANVRQFSARQLFKSYFTLEPEHTYIISPQTSTPLDVSDVKRFVNALIQIFHLSNSEMLTFDSTKKIRDVINHFRKKISKKHLDIKSFGEYAQQIGFILPENLAKPSKMVDSNNVALGKPQADDKRTKLAQLNDGKLHLFTAKFIRLGSSNEYNPSLLRPVLLRDIKYNGELVTQHAWVSDMIIHHIHPMTKIKFKARVYIYMKDFNSNNARDTSFATNYGIQNPKDVQVITD